jgi:DNA-binding CsgD family transcriptional regulator
MWPAGRVNGGNSLTGPLRWPAVPTDLRARLHDLALGFAGQIVASARSLSLRELLEPEAEAQGTLEERLSRTAAAWVATYKLSDAEVDVLCRAALGETQAEIARHRRTSAATVKTLKMRLLRRTRDASLEGAAKRLLRDVIQASPITVTSRASVAHDGRATSLETRIVQLRRLAAEPASDSTRYAIGAIVKDLKRHPDRYGDSAVSAAAAAIGEDQAGLYRFASVAERWTAHEVRVLLSGQWVSWSHLVALARVESPAVRANLLRRVRRERLPQKDLQVLVSRATK